MYPTEAIRFIACWALVALLVFPLCAVASAPSKLNSLARETQLKASNFLVITENLQSFIDSRGLQNLTLPWERDCKAECYQNKGTCNLLRGQCECPVGRVHSDAGVLC
jgi:hypothetical protein